MKFERSRNLREKSHGRIPGGCHTNAKGDDQFPESAPGFIARGEGCHVWDVDGNEFIEYGMGMRAVTLGHAYPPVVEVAARQLKLGANFTRPAAIELECADEFLSLIDGADMVKFCKNGSDATTAAVKLARAFTGRDLVAICAEQPFFSIDDWFIGTTQMDAGIPDPIKNLTVKFQYNNLKSIQQLFDRYPARIACLVMEPATSTEPQEGFLSGALEACQQNGALLIFDEMITGFRWHLKGAQKLYGVVPHLSAFGKGMANGFSVSALAGKKDVMKLGGLQQEGERVFLLSTTHGAETHGLAAALETMRIYQREDVVAALYRQGERLATGVRKAIGETGLEGYFEIAGRPCNLIYIARDRDKTPSQSFRTLFLQELIRRRILAPSFVVSYSHSNRDIDATIAAVRESLAVYKRALEEGIDRYLEGRPVKPVNRKFN